MDERTHSPRKRLRLGAILAVALAVGFVAWLLLKDDDDDSSKPTRPAAAAATASDLKAVSDSVGHPVYWAGRRAGYKFELTRLANGNVYVRYLSPEADIGAPRPDFLTVGTYPFKRAYNTLQRLARQEGAVSRTIDNGGLAVANKAGARNVYFAYPSEDFQVEVYDQSPGRALRLVTSGRIKPIP